MNCRVLLVVLSLVGSSAGALAQGTFQITFDGPPVVRPDSGIIATNYSESGFSFTPIPPSHGFTRMGGYGGGGNPYSQFPDDGSAYLDAELPDSLRFSRIDGAAFALVSVDLAEYSTLFSAVTVHFVGYRSDGSVVTTDFTTDGIIDGAGPLVDFQTFHFNPADWTALQRVEVPGWGWSMDNLVVSVPEPRLWSLLALGAAIWAGFLGRRRSG